MLRFEARGRRGDLYSITASIDFDAVNIRCTCPMGEGAYPCWHRVNLAIGSAEHLVSPDPEALRTLAGWIHGSSLQASLTDFFDTDRASKEAADRHDEAKRRLAAAMTGNPIANRPAGRPPERAPKPKIGRSILVACPDGTYRDVVPGSPEADEIAEMWSKTRAP